MIRTPLLRSLLVGVLLLAVTFCIALPAYAGEQGWLEEGASLIEELWDMATGWWAEWALEGDPNPDLGPTMDPNG